MTERDPALETAALAAAALRLRAAYGGNAIDPLRDVLDPTDAEGAYTVQRLNTEYWVEQGRSISGWKIGLTAEAVQKQLGVDQPDFGVLFADMALDNGGVLDLTRQIAPRGEAEIALVLGSAIDRADLGAEELAEAVEYVSPAIEIVDSRIADWKITFADTVSDNGSSARYVLGDSRAKLDGLDLYSCGMVLEVDGKVASLGAGACVPRSSAECSRVAGAHARATRAHPAAGRGDSHGCPWDPWFRCNPGCICVRRWVAWVTYTFIAVRERTVLRGVNRQ